MAILNILAQVMMFFLHLISRLNFLHLLTPGLEQKENKHSSSILNIMDVPDGIVLLILQQVGSYYVLLNAKRVCKQWYALSKDPYIWRQVDVRRSLLIEDVKKCMPSSGTQDYYQAVGSFLESIALCGVYMSGGRLFHLCIQDFGSDMFLLSVSQRCTELRSLTIIDRDPSAMTGCTIEGLVNILRNLPRLEMLQLHFTPITGEVIEVAGNSCPHLRSFALNSRTFSDYSYLQDRDEHAIAIAKSMPWLSCLKVVGNAMTSTGLICILESCHYLEILDIRDCYNLQYALDEDPDLEARVEEQIRQVRFPSEHYENDDGLDYY